MRGDPGEYPGSHEEARSHNESESLKVFGDACGAVAHGPTLDFKSFGTYLVPSGFSSTERLFRIRDLAKRWRVCTATIYGLAKSGRIRSLRIGNSLRVPASEVAAYEANRRGAATGRGGSR